MALKDLWGRLRGKTEEKPAPAAPSPQVPEEAAAAGPSAAPATPQAGAPAAPSAPGPAATAAPAPAAAPGLAPAPATLPGAPGQESATPAATTPPGATGVGAAPMAPAASQPVPATSPAPASAPASAAPPTPAAAAPAPSPSPAEPAPAAGGWFARLKAGLSRSTAKLTDSVTSLFKKRKLDDEALEELEETLILADLGVSAARRIVDGFRKTRFGKEVTDEEVKATLAEAVAEILAPVARPLVIEPARAPHVVLVVGVNGTGKTTTIAKLGQLYREQGLKVGMVAGDTFRAAAVEQLQVWADRTGARIFPPAKPGADAAGLAFDALTTARAEALDVLLVDTAGRLHNKSALMDELKKILRVMKRVDEAVPHDVLLVLDATTGQNAVQQVKVFKEMVDVTGLVVTKLDGSAKGGVVVALAQEFGLPVHAVGVGEKAADLRPFSARDFSRGLVGLD